MAIYARHTSWLLALLLGLAGAGAAAAAELESPHFRITYDAAKLSAAQAEEARDHAEAGWERCRGLFGRAPAQRILLDLTPNFAGATGFAQPADLEATDPRQAPRIGVRYADLDYLGIPARYVLMHEIAHVFSWPYARGPLSEEIADWATGYYGGVQLAPWWGPALRGAGLWIDPEALFITGDWQQSEPVDARSRTALYSEPALLVQFLVGEFGWERFAGFARRYGAVRRSLLPARTGARPDPEGARLAFLDSFGEPWEKLRERWEARMDAAHAPPGEAERLVLAQEIYGAIRNYEMWVLTRRARVKEEERLAIRRAFTEANQAAARGDLPSARARLREASDLVNAVKRGSPVIARARFGHGGLVAATGAACGGGK